jgi:dihydrofolate reductase
MQAVDSDKITRSRPERTGPMPRLRINCFAVSADGYGAGPAQSLEQPLGVGGGALHEWFIPTRTFRAMLGGGDGGTTGVDDEFAAAGIADLGAWILGRNMFGPVRGPWPDESWKGWWGDEPPYHVPAFVLTHHARAPITMAGGTEFIFVTGGIYAALELARSAAGDRDVRLGGGAATIRQYLHAGLIDQLHLAQRPVLLGAGESLFEGIDLRALGYTCNRSVAGERATHLFVERTPA